LDGGGDANPGALPSFKVAHSEDAPKDDPFANVILSAAVVDASSIIRRLVGLLVVVAGGPLSFDDDVSAFPNLLVTSSSCCSAVTTLMRLRVDAAHMEACLEREKTRGTEVHVVWASILVGQIFRGRLFFNDLLISGDLIFLREM
jgi:hypothetical protein